MKKMLNPALLTLLALAAPGLASTANAQYMYMDTNGNRVHDDGDKLNENGTPTVVDIYLSSNQNRDGSFAVSNEPGPQELDVFSYVVILQAMDGMVTYGNFSNRQPALAEPWYEFNTDGLRYMNGALGMPATALHPGTYLLCTLTITGVNGTPRIAFADLMDAYIEDLDVIYTDFTGFGTSCYGHDYDNTYKLAGPAGGSDWFDADGLQAANAGAAPNPGGGAGNGGGNGGKRCLGAAPGATTCGMLALMIVAALGARRG